MSAVSNLPSRRLTSAQARDLRELVRNPKFYAGSSLNKTMKALQANGLVRLEWFESATGYYGRDSRWVVTEAGKLAAAPEVPK